MVKNRHPFDFNARMAVTARTVAKRLGARRITTWTCHNPASDDFTSRVVVGMTPTDEELELYLAIPCSIMNDASKIEEVLETAIRRKLDLPPKVHVPHVKKESPTSKYPPWPRKANETK